MDQFFHGAYGGQDIPGFINIRHDSKQYPAFLQVVMKPGIYIMPKLGWWGRGGGNGNGNSARTHQHLCLHQHQGYKGGLQGKTYKRKTGKMASKRGKTPLSGVKT